MRNRLITLLVVGYLGIGSAVYAQEAAVPAAEGQVSEPAADKPAEYFFYRCAGCHTVGGGKLTGPDLITSAAWSRNDLKMAVKKMEKNVGPLTEADLAQIVEFLKDPTVSTRIAQQKQKIEAKLLAELPPPSFETGRDLFRGRKALSSGGPACVSCHQFAGQGGTLGPDLTPIKDKLTGVALQSAIENASYKVMRSIYEKQKITKVEALHLAEYLSHPEKAETGFHFGLKAVGAAAAAGLAGFAALLVLWNAKRKRPARENLFRKDTKR